MIKVDKILDIVRPFCDKIEFKGHHYKCFIKGQNKIIMISATPSDCNYVYGVRSDFRRLGIELKELKKLL